MKEGYEVIVFTSIKDELEKLSKNEKKLKDKEAAALALKLLDFQYKKKVIGMPKGGDNADDDILEFIDSFKNERVIVATSDKELKARLKGKASFLEIKAKHLKIV